ncbi:hypothetical protein ACLOJK_003939 [Asimina triloba]
MESGEGACFPFLYSSLLPPFLIPFLPTPKNLPPPSPPSISMASWLSISLPNPFKSLEEEEEDEEEEEEENENEKIAAITADEESEEEEDIGNGVREDLSELTKTIGRQLWGVASFLAPPPPSPPPAPSGPVAEEPQSPSSPSSQVLLGGIRSDFAEIGGSFKTGLSRLTTNKTVNEISRLASSLLQLEPDDDGDDEGSAPAAGVTEEVLDFAIGASARPEPWLEFPLPHDDGNS